MRSLVIIAIILMMSGVAATAQESYPSLPPFCQSTTDVFCAPAISSLGNLTVPNNITAGGTVSVGNTVIGSNAITLASPIPVAPKLDIVDYIPNNLYASDGVNLFYTNTGANVVEQRDSTGNVLQTGVNFSTLGANLYVKLIVASKTPNLIFILGWNNSSNKYYLYKSINGGLTVGNNSPTFDNGAYVMMLGDVDGTVASQIANTTFLYDRGFCDAVMPDGSHAYFLGEYGVASDAAPQQIRLMRSTDLGTTWTAFQTWNAAGSTMPAIRHIHVIKQNPYTGKLYMGVGDYAAHAQVFIWDGQSAPTQANIAGSGQQRYRTVDFLFAPDFVLTMADQFNDPDSGIWKWKPDFSSGTLVDTQVNTLGKQSGWFGFVSSTGHYYFTTQIDVTETTNLTAKVFSSADGTHWSIVGDIGTTLASLPGMVTTLFELGGRVWTSLSAGSAKDAAATLVLAEAGAFTDEWPVILHPVFWVSPDGTDDTVSRRGWSPGRPWQSIRYALLSSNITYGSRVIVAPGTYANTFQTMATWNANSRPGVGKVVVEGSGSSATNMYLASGSGDISLIYFTNANNGDVLLKQLALYSQKVSAPNYVLYLAAPSGTQTVYLRDVTIGSASYSNVYGIYWNATLDAKRVIVNALDQGGLVKYGTDSGSATFVSSIFNGGSHAVYINKPGSLVSLYNCVIANTTTSGVTLTAGANTTPIVKNTIFYTPSAAYSISDSSGLTETDAQIDYNLYAQAGKLQNIANSGGSHSITAAPELVNTTAGDFRPLAWSPALGHGFNLGAGYNLDLAKNDRNALGGPWDIGAHAFAGNYRQMSVAQRVGAVVDTQGFSVNGAPGVSINCAPGQTFVPTSISGGIIVAGKCQ
jgi:hypothetical protein